MVNKNWYIASVDISDVYYSASVALGNQKYLMFSFEDKLFKFLCLSNGLSSAPRVFTKLLKSALSYLRKLINEIKKSWDI